jgi:hypothetical protein
VDVVNDELASIRMEAVVVYFKVLKQHFSGEI